GYLGKWSVDETGKLIAEEVVTKRLEVGTTEQPTGITIYDKITKEPYCLSLENGTVVTSQGKCGAVSVSTPEPEPVIDTTMGTSTATTTPE
ncbi:MAG: hypothetical protein Q8R29_00620, partial [bacterium]|nr:hypothetical protein [bacterium]